jgi:hypothetical protein
MRTNGRRGATQGVAILLLCGTGAWAQEPETPREALAAAHARLTNGDVEGARQDYEALADLPGATEPVLMGARRGILLSDIAAFRADGHADPAAAEAVRRRAATLEGGLLPDEARRLDAWIAALPPPPPPAPAAAPQPAPAVAAPRASAPLGGPSIGAFNVIAPNGARVRERPTIQSRLVTTLGRGETFEGHSFAAGETDSYRWVRDLGTGGYIREDLVQQTR